MGTFNYFIFKFKMNIIFHCFLISIVICLFGEAKKVKYYIIETKTGTAKKGNHGLSKSGNDPPRNNGHGSNGDYNSFYGLGQNEEVFSSGENDDFDDVYEDLVENSW